MRNVVYVVAVALVLTASFTAFAQQGPAGPGPGPGMGRGMQQDVAPEKFPELKAQVLKNIDERMKRMTEHRACVEKAANHEEMKKCRPEPPMGGGPMGGGGPMRRGAQPPMQPGAGGGK